LNTATENPGQFVILGAGKPFKGAQHSGLQRTGDHGRVLDWLLLSVAEWQPETHFVSGYRADDIRAQYPQLRYSHNADWQQSGAAASLLLVPLKTQQPALVSYADIVYHQSTVARLREQAGDIVVAVDSQWRHRFAGRSDADLQRCEKVNIAGARITRLGADIPVARANGEFVGLALFSPRALEQIDRQRPQLQATLQQARLSELIEWLRLEGLEVSAVDLRGQWAELDEPSDLTRFILGTKAQTLQRLRKLVRHSRIEDQVSFRVAEWQRTPSTVLARIQKRFAGLTLVVRSSALSEDGFSSANAGAYSSLLDVAADNRAALQSAIEQVIASYGSTQQSADNQVLVQPMVQQALLSGVVFTRTLSHGAPYYVINYDDVSGSTESITSGHSQHHKTLVVLRDSALPKADQPPLLRQLLPALREIEQLLHYDALDIEFAISAQGQLHILQVRPIAVEHQRQVDDDKRMLQFINEAQQQFQQYQSPGPNIVGERATFGLMPDWNPAEIIGTNPGRLASSLYRYLILDDIWAQQRAEYGYRDVRPQPLLRLFAGHPYVDIRASFNSLIPASLDDTLATQLVDFFQRWLTDHPQLHDKIEFDVVPTCMALDFPRWQQRLQQHAGLQPSQIGQLAAALRKITLQAPHHTHHALAQVNTLEARWQQIRQSGMPPLTEVRLLLDVCRKHGTLPFAHLARSAFIAITLLRSAVSTQVISQPAMDGFLNSIRSVSHQLTNDATACARGTLPWSTLVARYAHLRPGTYDITCASYGDDPEQYLRPIVEHAAQSTTNHQQADTAAWPAERAAFFDALQGVGLLSGKDTQQSHALEQFMRDAIEGRESAKFAFSRLLSSALDTLAAWGKQHRLSRTQLSHLSISHLLMVEAGEIPGTRLGEWLAAEAQQGAVHRSLTRQIELPPLLLQEHDFFCFHYPDSSANFIGSKQVSARCVNLGENSHSGAAQLTLRGRIVLIPQADPGYDWLFARGIAGLITCYGGANSHMAIRAAEFGLPAAIGVGDHEFQRLSQATALTLDCGNRQIQPIHLNGDNSHASYRHHPAG